VTVLAILGRVEHALFRGHCWHHIYPEGPDDSVQQRCCYCGRVEEERLVRSREHGPFAPPHYDFVQIPRGRDETPAGEDKP
jgi:hypothetical protein